MNTVPCSSGGHRMMFGMAPGLDVGGKHWRSGGDCCIEM